MAYGEHGMGLGRGILAELGNDDTFGDYGGIGSNQLRFIFLFNSLSRLNYQGYLGKKLEGVALLNSLSPSVLNSQSSQPYEGFLVS